MYCVRKEHLTYTVGVQSNYTSQPVAGENLNIHLSTAKENADKAVSLVYSILDDVKAGRFTADEFKAAMVPLAVDEEQAGAASQSNSDPSVWMALLNIYAETATSYLQMIMPLLHQYSRPSHHKISLL